MGGSGTNGVTYRSTSSPFSFSIVIDLRGIRSEEVSVEVICGETLKCLVVSLVVWITLNL